MEPTSEALASVRRMADEPGTETYTDGTLSALLATKESPEQVAALLWSEKAGRYAKLVNTSESGSSRSMSDLHKNALTMAKYYDSLGATPVAQPGVVDLTVYPMTVDIERA